MYYKLSIDCKIDILFISQVPDDKQQKWRHQRFRILLLTRLISTRSRVSCHSSSYTYERTASIFSVSQHKLNTGDEDEERHRETDERGSNFLLFSLVTLVYCFYMTRGSFYLPFPLLNLVVVCRLLHHCFVSNLGLSRWLINSTFHNRFLILRRRSAWTHSSPIIRTFYPIYTHDNI
jgi:hypothetical protein